ncbi:type IV pilus modification protein PilV [Rhizobacter sp. Root1221]|uniref:type IV pilus modification protein PilV n=1 Tax=Rhizobacter sp. Root1221 TaxID=1736433 RepID=UPI000B0ED127|nr:type IV pilus modification protein PilV [Rhizobacter sp. Root1221]
MKPSQKRQRGMSLIEALTTVLIFSVGLMGLVGLQSRAIQFSSSAEDTNRAALLANDLTAQMRLSKSITVNATELQAWKDRVSKPAEGGLPNGVGNVTQRSATEVDITIQWKSPNAATTEPMNKYQTQFIL